MRVPQMKQELAQARAPQFIQDVPVLGLSRGEIAVREIAPTTKQIVFSFYLPDQFQNISYELKDPSGSVGPRIVLPAPPREDSAESHLSISTAGLKPGAYETKPDPRPASQGVAAMGAGLQRAAAESGAGCSPLRWSGRVHARRRRS